MKKIAIIGVYKDNNLGDPLVFDCNKYMIEKAAGYQIEIEYFDFMARRDIKPFITSKNTPFEKGFEAKPSSSHILQIIKKIIGKKNVTALSQKLRWVKNRRRLESYYEKAFEHADLALIAGAGTIKWGIRRDYSRYYGLVEKYATKFKIPIVVSSAGVEDAFDGKDSRCIRFSKVLSSDSFKIVTTRDNVAELRKYILNPRTDVARVSDFGIFASETYNITRNATSDCIGIGIIASSRFTENGKGISADQYKQTIFDIVRQLEKKGKKWKFFTNGGLEDSMLALEFCDQLNVEPTSRLIVPTSPRELVNTISLFQGIITSRLHSCIVAYSLDVPFIVISWNDKVAFFAKYAGCPDRVVTMKNLSSSNILDLLQKAMIQGFDETIKENNRKVATEYAKRYIKVLEQQI